MLKMISGCNVPDCSMLNEEYQITKYGFTANVNADKLNGMFRHFIDLQNVPLFFILELPTNGNEEKRLRMTDEDALHKDVYYIDGISNGQANELLDKYGELLINDGLIRFGFGVFDNSAEIMKKKYNVVDVYTKQRDKYDKFFQDLGIARSHKVVTAWDTFSEQEPGESRRIEVDGLDAYKMLEELRARGIYFAERRDD